MKTQVCPICALESLNGTLTESRPKWLESAQREYTTEDSGIWYGMGFGFGASFFPAARTGGES